MLGNKLGSGVASSSARDTTKVQRNCCDRKVHQPGIDIFEHVIVRNNQRNRNASCSQSSIGRLSVGAETDSGGSSENRFVNLQEISFFWRSGKEKIVGSLLLC